jgi:hypothetical protein
VQILSVCGLLLGRPWGPEIIRPVQTWGAWPSRDPDCLWITSLAGLKGALSGVKILQDGAGLQGAAWQSRDHSVPVDHQLNIPWGHSLAEIVNACGLLSWQALGTRSNRADIVQAFAGLRGVGQQEQRL